MRKITVTTAERQMARQLLAKGTVTDSVLRRALMKMARTGRVAL